MDNIYTLKFGGNAIRGHDDMIRLSKDIAEMIGSGARIVLVHGGGPEISEEMERRGMTPRKVSGVRVTDADGLEVAETVLRRINAEIVSCLAESKVESVGIPGYFCTVCRKKAPIEAPDGTMVDLGLVGEVEAADPSPILDLLEQGVTPVIYPIGKDSEGNTLNVNADTMASGIAACIPCREMIAITDVPGILTDVGDPDSKLDSVTLADIDAMIADGTISGGMIPKVEACRAALLSGIPKVRMVNGRDPDCIVSDVMTNSKHGTVITK